MAGTLKVKIQEDIILDNQNYGSKRVFEISSIANITKKIVTIAADDDATVLVFKSTTAIADGALDLQTVKYIRITNLDSSNSVNISLQLDSDENNSAADASISHLLEAGRNFIMGTPDEAAHCSTANANIITALTDLESIIIDPGSNSGQVEVFVAST